MRSTYYKFSAEQTDLNHYQYFDSVRIKFNLTEDEIRLLRENHFVVTERLSFTNFGLAFHAIYQRDLPVFVTTDAILHALHVSYDQLLSDIELAIMKPNLEKIVNGLYSSFPLLVQKYEQNSRLHQALGDIDLYGIHLQANNLLQSGLDVFLSWGYDRSDPNGKSVNPGGGVTYGLLSDDGHDRKSGSAIYVGARYTIPWDQLRNPKVGFEFNHGSKYWMSMTSGTAELFNKLATRGDVYELYYIQPVDKNIFFRAGYTHVDYDYTMSGWHIGHPESSKAEMDNYYLLMDCRF